MNDDRIIALIWIAGALTLAGSALARSGLAGRFTLKLALLWLGIILVAWGAVVLLQRSSM